MTLNTKSIWIGFAFLFGMLFIEIVSTSTLAQSPPGQDPGKSGPGAPKPPISSGETMLKFLGVREVREEIEISEDQAMKLRLRGEAIREEVEVHLRKLVDEAIEDVLSTSQISRLKEITTQLLGVEAMFDPAIVAKLELSIGQVKQLKAIRISIASEIEDMKRIFKGKEGETDRFFLEEELRSEVKEKMLRVLTQKQRLAFEKMHGKPFSAPHIPGVNAKGPKEPKASPETKGPPPKEQKN